MFNEDVSIFVETDGKPTRETGIDWSGAPEEIGYSYPYLIAILPKHVEVRNILTQTLVQTIELLHARFINAGKYLYIASHSTVWRFIPYNFEKQARNEPIDQLVEQMEYVEAISLTMQIDTIYLQDKEAKLKYIRNLHGHNLFRQHKFEEAISIFIDLEADPKEIVALYPPAISASLRSDSSHNKKLHLNGSANKLTTDGVSEEHDQETETVSDSETIIKNDSKLEGKDLEEAIKQLIRFLTDRRAKVHKLLLQRQLSKSTTKENEDHLIELAEFVETSLLKAYMNSNDSLVGSLVRVKNFCNVEETEKLLSERKKYRELVEFYHEKGLYRKSLELLKRLGESTEGPMNGTFQTIQYLQKLGSDHFDLILEFATWVLKADPVDGMEIFIGDHPKVETLPRSKVLDYLEKFSPDLCITYIGHIIHELGDKHPDHHNRLIYAYLKKLQDLKQEGAEPVIVEEANKNFLQFLEESSYYIAEKILGHLPMDDYYEARAILLSRLGQHDQALNIYVHKLKDEQLAEEYCLKIYNEADEKAKNVFLSLLRVYLRPKSGEPVMIEPAIRLLSRHGAHVDASKALDMLPPSIEVAQLYKFVEKYIRESNRNRCINIIVKNLLKADQYQVQEQLLFYRSRRVKIDDDRMCPQCTRRIAHSVFAVFPNGVVVHYHCKDKYSQAHDTAA
ncbi:4772_t:CDS:10 [Paraglomus brasilianum]|uniref:4772_t:CDS:1 n=1 Tax=Paraglomus brasilianum TaxID=144538 RepID=A0A9N9GPM5_9GLOM|nr:4772_t:CDS:10 [Paraglomus brasilianum]